MKHILVINGHPDPESFNQALANAYIRGAQEAHFDIEKIDLHSIAFNPNLAFGMRVPMELESELKKAQELIKWADHIVITHPVWWGGMPALLKGFIDRVFLSGFAYKFHAGSSLPEQLLKGKSARIITTMDQPYWFYCLYFKRPSINQLKRVVLNFCGISPVRVSVFESPRRVIPEKREMWLKKVEELGRKGE